ncbi:MAG: flagellin [Planctomycetota bacterium]|nr:flagellin FliC [Planctomycetota bacterium]MDP6839068.1 flagellin [Planctomycetota bacterium]MDP6957136.1 flagellin [Planctomycetota bacterium]
MGLRINTNIASLNTQRSLMRATSNLGDNMRRLAGGLRVASAADDAAGLAISNKMMAAVRSWGGVERYIQIGIDVTRTALSGLSEQQDAMQRMRELAVQSMNGVLSDEDRAVVDMEFQELLNHVQQIALNLEFNGTVLLNGDEPRLRVHVGIEVTDFVDIELPTTRTPALGIDTLDISTLASAGNAIDTLDPVLDTMSSFRGRLGARQNALSSALRQARNAREQVSAAASRIRDVDIASETADMTRNRILQEASTAVLAQANVQPQLALELLS